ncbi:MAG TPA: hypothetical protein VKW76_11160 [Candidatus Binatia bacterium]|nr:hypothetical protein [Candidatus Binatia bacterium]
MSLTVNTDPTLTNAQAPATGLQAVFAAAAQYLGLSPQDLRAELGSGKTLAGIAQTEGKSLDGLKTALLAAAGASPGSPLATRIDQIVNGSRAHHGHHRLQATGTTPLAAGGSDGDADDAATGATTLSIKA